MYYSLKEAKEKILIAGRLLVEKGLVARSWGNISARISEEEFVITPSGRLYEDLTEKDLVVCKVSDASYEGNIKPSSEKFLHAGCYSLRKNCSFIIHTHQFFATSISVTEKDFPFAPAARYEEPGSKALADASKDCLIAHPECSSFLLVRHGAVMLGESFEDAFEKSERLESLSKEEFYSKVNDIKRSESFEGFFDEAKKKAVLLPSYLDDFAQIIGPYADLTKTEEELCQGEDSWAEKLNLEKNCCAFLYAFKTGACPMDLSDSENQRDVFLNSYSKLKDSNK